MPNVIGVIILNGKSKGKDVLIPSIPAIPTDMPFEFKPWQFPVRLAFSMTINKAEGQSLQESGLNVEHLCFAHGKLYVACSRVGNTSELFTEVLWYTRYFRVFPSCGKMNNFVGFSTRENANI